MTKHRILVFLVITSLILVACGLFASPDSNSGTQQEDTTKQPVAPSEEPSLESPVSEEDVLPLTPDPINVTATLETENTATYNKGSYNQSIETESTDGVVYDLELLKDTIFKVDENGELAIDYDSDLTMTPVSAIEGLPFSQGYLAAVHLGPDGAILLRSASLTMEIPGEYDPSTLIGFAADGTGDDLHLYPAMFSAFDGKTYAMFDVMHFSLYGVAQVVQSEIVAQKKHPPVKPASQIEQELAPLPTYAQFEEVMNKAYDQLINQKIVNLDKIACNKVSTVVVEHNQWVARVKNAGLTETFQDRISIDRYALLNRLTECVKVTCDTCVNPKPGVKPDKKKVESMIVMMIYAMELSGQLKLGDEKTTNWFLLANQCAKTAGLPPIPGGGAAEDWGGGSAPKATCP